jgi:hypothetical protein
VGTNNPNLGGAGEITLIVFCVVILSIWLYSKKRVFQGLAIYSHKRLGIARELLAAKVGIARALNCWVCCQK